MPTIPHSASQLSIARFLIANRQSPIRQETTFHQPPSHPNPLAPNPILQILNPPTVQRRGLFYRGCWRAIRGIRRGPAVANPEEQLPVFGSTGSRA